jgi:hypothetical protein
MFHTISTLVALGLNNTLIQKDELNFETAPLIQLDGSSNNICVAERERAA